MRNVPFQIREQLTPGSANAFKSSEMLNNYLNKEKRKALVVYGVTVELETDFEYADGDEFLIQIVDKELTAEGFLDDANVLFKRKFRIALTTSGKIEFHQVQYFPCPKNLIITTNKYWIQIQTVGQSAAIVTNVVLDAVMGFIPEATWNKITAPDS